MGTKSILRLKSSLQESILDMLNAQIKMEAHSTSAYLAMSAWCHEQGLIECGDYYKHQSDEEREHMLRIYDYIIDMGGKAISPEVSNIQHEFADLRALFELALEMEVAITDSFNKMSATCVKNADFQTLKFFDWFLEEQKEEEDNARRALEIYDLIGIELDGLFQIDHQVAKLGKKA
ncbi:MAG: ferritin [Cytophagales bacterium]|nr:MAG: ferritin [Cytophagales bacterium]